MYALLDNVQHRPHAAMDALRLIEEDARTARAVAQWVITGQATPFSDEPSPRLGLAKIVVTD